VTEGVKIDTFVKFMVVFQEWEEGRLVRSHKLEIVPLLFTFFSWGDRFLEEDSV